MSGSSPEQQSDRPSAAVSREDSPAAKISNLVVGLLHSYTGRGPTRAWTSIDADLVSVVLQDTLTKGERSLVGDGKSQVVLDTRKAYQLTMRADLVAGVEEITGRKVIAFLSDNHLDPDVAVENFVLEPRAANNGSLQNNPIAGSQERGTNHHPRSSTGERA